jgi:cobalt-zinc-cadmium efflux system outer membrane protein
MRRRCGSRCVAAVVLIALQVASTDAQQPPLPSAAGSPWLDRIGGIGLDEAIALAREREPSLQAARADADVARGQRRESGLRPNPSLTFENRHEPGGTDHLVSAGVEWPLDLFRRSGRVATADREVTVAESVAADRERLLIADVVLQYGRAVAAIREAQVAADLAATVEAQATSMRARADDGAAPRLESDLLQVEVRRLQAQRDLADGRAERAVIALKPLLGMAAGERLPLREPLEALVATHATPNPLAAATGASSRADVRAAKQRELVAEARIDQARREGRFDVSLFGAYMRMDAGFPQFGVSSTGVPERVRGQFDYVSAGAVVMLPLLNRNQGRIAAAQAERTAADARRRAIELAAASEVAAATARAERARKALSAYGDSTRELARRNLDVVRQTFELGRATVFDVLTEQRRYLEFEQGYTAALLEAWEAHADLGRAAGEAK